MQSQTNISSENKIILTSPEGVPAGFTVSISNADALNNAPCEIEVTGPKPQTRTPKTQRYHLPDREHHSYLNLFQHLAADFGLRLPQNRRQAATKPAFEAAYRPVLSQNLAPGMRYGYGDPAVIRVNPNGTGQEVIYYLLVTSNDAPDSFPILRSRNLFDWEFVDYVFPEGNKPVWAADGEFISDYWAPEMHQVGDEFRVYFVARDKHSRELCIGLARSAHPEGPFIPEEKPVLAGNVIDPHLFVQEDGTAFLYWKEDNNDVWPGQLVQLLYENPALIAGVFARSDDQVTACLVVTLWPWVRTLEPMERFLANQVLIEAIIERFLEFYHHLEALVAQQPLPVQQQMRSVLKYMKTPMYAQQLSPDGATVVGNRTKVIENDLAWEAHLVEGMWVTEQAAKYYLFYAGNDFSTDQYGIGVAVADTPLGPYRKMQTSFLRSTADWWAPGHPSVVTALDGKPTMFLHAYFPKQAGYKQFRALLAVPLSFRPDG
ncbi:MAG: b-xylosidase/arabinofuranosidase, Glycoside Hydrolase Family 43-like protein, partial [Adhaeribacter sp.]|nr:b-xylosidase/arabinofuranosidase, Glycoside Hydrolase Family 43-like protein [Adhaeribacter sp.]